MHVLPVPLTLVTAISTLRITVPPDLRPAKTRKETLDTVKVGLAWNLYHRAASWKHLICGTAANRLQQATKKRLL